MNNAYVPIGLAVRFWQLGMEMRPFFNKESLWAYPVFAAVGGSFGYWMTGVERRQLQILTDNRNRLHEKRRRRAEKAGETVEAKSGTVQQAAVVTGS